MHSNVKERFYTQSLKMKIEVIQMGCKVRMGCERTRGFTNPSIHFQLLTVSVNTSIRLNRVVQMSCSPLASNHVIPLAFPARRASFHNHGPVYQGTHLDQLPMGLAVYLFYMSVQTEGEANVRGWAIASRINVKTLMDTKRHKNKEYKKYKKLLHKL